MLFSSLNADYDFDCIVYRVVIIDRAVVDWKLHSYLEGHLILVIRIAAIAALIWIIYKKRDNKLRTLECRQ